jgi:hypothetical protein
MCADAFDQPPGAGIDPGVGGLAARSCRQQRRGKLLVRRCIGRIKRWHDAAAGL